MYDFIAIIFGFDDARKLVYIRVKSVFNGWGEPNCSPQMAIITI